MRESSIPTILLGGTGSGCGKTTLTCALLGALSRRGLRVQPFKCGPDYIDPMHHTRITGRASRNLDSWLLDRDTLAYLFRRAAADADLAVVEGVMGYYDGLGGNSFRGSTLEVAQWLGAKTVLIVDCAGRSLSVAAVIRGFSQFVDDSRVAGVILNHASAGLYQLLRRPVEEHTGLPVLGHFPRMTAGGFASRHLGLVTANEIADFDARVARLADTALETIDLNALLRLAAGAGQRDGSFVPPPSAPIADCTIAVARDEAFCFYYQDNLDLLQQLGARLVAFSPLRDAGLPDGCCGLYLGGGYPELHAAALEQNTRMRQAIQAAVHDGMPTLAECGGFLYLLREYRTEARAYRLAGVIDGSFCLTERLGRFGYQELVSNRDHLLARAGTTIKAHEFHYSRSTADGSDCTAGKPSRPDVTWSSVHAGPSLFAGYPHLHFWSDPRLAQNYLQACRRYRQRRPVDEH